MISLILPDSSELLPSANLCDLSSKFTASSKTDLDIYGNSTVIQSEIKSGNKQWTLTAAYIPVEFVKAAIAAHAAQTHLTMQDEAGANYSVVIAEFPNVERFKQPDGTLSYTVQVTLSKTPETTWTVPVVDLNSARQFGR